MSGFIPLSVPNFGEKEAAYAAEAITSGWVSTSGAKVSEFEEALAADGVYQNSHSIRPETDPDG